MHATKYFLFLSIASIMVSGSFSGLPAAYAGDTISLHDLGVLQLAAHDLFNVDRGDGSSAAVATDFENGKLDLSTLFFDMTSPIHEQFSNEDIAKGGEPRNRENIILFSVASDIGQTYVDNVLINGKSEYAARQIALADYHMRFNEAYENAFGESVPNPIEGCATMTENLAFRTVHDFLPGFIRLDTAAPFGEITDPEDTPFLTIFDPDLGIPAGLGFTPPFTDPGMNPNNHVGPLLAFELDQPTSELDSFFDSQFLDIDIFIPPSTFIVVDLLAADKSFGVQFNIDKYSTPETSFQHFLDELADGSYDPNEDVMFEIRNLIAKAYGHGCYIGGDIIPIEATSLLLSSAQTFSWMIPVLLSGIGIGLFVVSRKSENY